MSLNPNWDAVNTHCSQLALTIGQIAHLLDEKQPNQATWERHWRTLAQQVAAIGKGLLGWNGDAPGICMTGLGAQLMLRGAAALFTEKTANGADRRYFSPHGPWHSHIGNVSTCIAGLGDAAMTQDAARIQNYLVRLEQHSLRLKELQLAELGTQSAW